MRMSVSCWMAIPAMISLLLECPIAAGPADDAARADVSMWGVEQVGTIQNPSIKECSGIVASRRYPGVFWVHNDGGGRKRQVLYAMDRSGKTLASFPVTGVKLSDWEDLAIDDHGRVYLGDLGNNELERDRLQVCRVDEPDPKILGANLQPNATWTLLFPDHAFDCESLFVTDQAGYVISKVGDDKPAQLFRFNLSSTNAPVVLEFVARLPVTSPVSGADLSPDGRYLGLVTKSWAYVMTVDGDLTRADRAAFRRSRAPNKTIEGCCFVPEGLLATAESRQIYLFPLTQ